MKKLLLLFLICFEASIYAQSFTMSFDSYTKRDTLNSEIVFDGHIKNVSSQNISVYFVRKLNDLPANWTSSFCFDNCFPPTLDSIATTADFLSSPLTPNETREFSIHVSPAVIMGTAKIKVLVGNLRDAADTMSFNFEVTSISDVNDKNIVSGFNLEQNYPNPFNPSTNIKFSLDKPSFVNLSVYNIAGQKVSTVVNKQLSSGSYNINYNAEGLSSGIYLYRLTVDGKTFSRKMMLEK